MESGAIILIFFILLALVILLIRRGDKKAHNEHLEIIRKRIEERERQQSDLREPD